MGPGGNEGVCCRANGQNQRFRREDSASTENKILRDCVPAGDVSRLERKKKLYLCLAISGGFLSVLGPKEAVSRRTNRIQERRRATGYGDQIAWKSVVIPDKDAG